MDLAKTGEKSLQYHVWGKGGGNGLEKEEYMPCCSVKDATGIAWFRLEI
jgi:hypothetical protein